METGKNAFICMLVATYSVEELENSLSLGQNDDDMETWELSKNDWFVGVNSAIEILNRALAGNE